MFQNCVVTKELLSRISRLKSEDADRKSLSKIFRFEICAVTYRAFLEAAEETSFSSVSEEHVLEESKVNMILLERLIFENLVSL